MEYVWSFFLKHVYLCPHEFPYCVCGLVEFRSFFFSVAKSSTSKQEEKHNTVTYFWKLSIHIELVLQILVFLIRMVS